VNNNFIDPVTIGGGAAVVDPLLPTIFPGQFGLKPTIFRLAYLMYRAKKDYSAIVGGPTDLVVMPFGFPLPKGAFWVDREEMDTVEELIEYVDEITTACVLGLLSGEGNQDQKKFLETFNTTFLDRAGIFEKMRFPSLERQGLL
jgi:hypothetical protein